MLVKFFNSGKGSARHAFNYLLNEKRVKDGSAKLVFGNPDVITFLTEQRMKAPNYRGGALYTSGVLSFSADETAKLNPSIVSSILNRFELTIFPDLDRSRFNIAWIRHSDKGRAEFHFVIQNYDLERKKVFTPFVKERDLSRVNMFKNKVNADFELSNPELSHSHFYIKGLKRLTDEQKSFFQELNKAYSEYVFEKQNPSLISQAKGFFSAITGKREPYSHDLLSNKDKSWFLQNFITERFSGLKINRISEKYISVDFGSSKMRLFFEKQQVRDFDDAKKIKVEQNKAKGIVSDPAILPDVWGDLVNNYKLMVKEKAEVLARKKREDEEKAKREEQEKFDLLLKGSRKIFLQSIIDSLIQEFVKKHQSLGRSSAFSTESLHSLFSDLNAYKVKFSKELELVKSNIQKEYGEFRYKVLSEEGFFNSEILEKELNLSADKILSEHKKSMYREIDSYDGFTSRGFDYALIDYQARNVVNFDGVIAFTSDLMEYTKAKEELRRNSDNLKENKVKSDSVNQVHNKPSYSKMKM